MKNLSYFTLLFLLLLSACQYDYMPIDMSGAYPIYRVSVDEEWQQKLEKQAISYGLTYAHRSPSWEIFIQETDEKGVVLYEGKPRNFADPKTKYISGILLRCMCGLSSFSGLTPICDFHIDQSFPLEINPFTQIIELNESSHYSIQELPDSVALYLFYAYGNCPKSITDFEKQYGYIVYNASKYIIFYDEQGNIIGKYRHPRNQLEEVISPSGAYYVSVEIDLYGTYNSSEHIGTLYTRKWVIKDYKFSTIEYGDEDVISIAYLGS